MEYEIEKRLWIFVVFVANALMVLLSKLLEMDNSFMVLDRESL